MNNVQYLLYQQLFNRVTKGQPKPQKVAMVCKGKLITGNASLHNTPQSRKIRLLWRFRFKRLSNTQVV